MEQPWYNLPKTNYSNSKAIVIGAGLAGTFVSYSLAKKGWNVTLIEKNKNLASEASGNAAGIISPLISHKNDIIGKFYLEGFLQTIRHIKNLNKESVKLKHDFCGVLEISADKIDKDIESLVVSNELIEKLSPSEASNICGQKLPNSALYIKKGGWVNPVELCKANIEAYKNNIEVFYNSEVIKLINDNNKWSIIGEGGNVLAQSDIVIVANSNDAKSFCQTNWLPLTPVRGQITYLSNLNTTSKKVICYKGGYIIPQIDSINYVGATFDRKNRSGLTNDEDDRVNIDNLSKVIDVDGCEVEGSRASFRATSPDRRPIIGAVPIKEKFLSDYDGIKHGKTNKRYPNGQYYSGLYVSTGFGSRGITGCSIAGEIIANMINNEPLPIDQKIMNSINPARFIIRDLKRNSNLQAYQ